nr:MAG TPA: hypothetical protein [Caudoviricetes sp.]
MSLLRRHQQPGCAHRPRRRPHRVEAAGQTWW